MLSETDPASFDPCLGGIVQLHAAKDDLGHSSLPRKGRAIRWCVPEPLADGTM